MESSHIQIVTIFVVIVGFVVQYIAIIKQFSERIARLETDMEAHKKFHVRIDEDIDTISKDIKEIVSRCKNYRLGGSEI